MSVNAAVLVRRRERGPPHTTCPFPGRL